MRTKRETLERSRGTGNQRGTQAHGTSSFDNDGSKSPRGKGEML